MGVGLKTTPNAFVQSCEVFTFSENIAEEVPVLTQTRKVIKTRKAQKANKAVREEVATRVSKYPPVDINLINKAYDLSTNEE